MRRILSLAAVLLAPLPLFATTVVLPGDLGRLAQSAGLVTLATVRQVRPGPDFMTHVLFSAQSVVKGPQDLARFIVAVPGGEDAEVGLAVPGFPRFEPGKTYLLFLGPLQEGIWQPLTAALGVFVSDNGILKPVAEAEGVWALAGDVSSYRRAYRQDALLTQLRKALAGLPYDLAEAAIVGAQELRQPSGCVRMTHSDGIPLRWFNFETGLSLTVSATTPGQIGLADGGAGAVQQGTAAWHNYSAAVLRLTYGGVQPRNLDCGQGNRGGEVWFNDPCNQITDLVGCSGVLAFGGSHYLLTTQTYDGQTWHPGLLSGTYGPFVVVNNGSQCIGATNFAEMMTHELGHTLFFGHHSDPNAVMYATCCRGGGAQIYTTDKVCASDQYHTFLDVPYAHWAWSYIEGVEDAGITSGCGSGNYCPQGSVTRAQMAVFLLKAKHGGSYVPPPCTGLFTDVPCPGYWAADWIEALAGEGITSGCGGGKYCPDQTITRAQMAVFLLKAKYGSAYLPPACTGVFPDVPCPSHWAVNWIEQLYHEGVTSGCGGGLYCPGGEVSRAQMAVFLVKNFALTHP